MARLVWGSLSAVLSSLPADIVQGGQRRDKPLTGDRALMYVPLSPVQDLKDLLLMYWPYLSGL